MLKKRENVRYTPVLPSPTMFSNASLIVLVLTFYHTIPIFNNLKKETFRKHCGKRRKCRQPAFSPFPHNIFYPSPKQISIFHSHLCCRLHMLSISTTPKFCQLGQRVKVQASNDDTS